LTALHQFLPVFASGDAIGGHVLRIRDALREAGYESEIFADDIHPPVRRHARHYREFKPPANGAPTWLLYHLSTGSRIATFLAEQPLPVAVDYHNITPAPYLERWMPEAGAVARAARAEMRLLASVSRFALADSTYNAEELMAQGYRDASVVPILVDFSEYDVPPDPAVMARLARLAQRGGARWLYVGRLAANKCQHDLIAAFAVYRKLFDGNARLSVVGGWTLPLYVRALERLAADLGVTEAVEFTNVLTFPQLLAEYRSADVYVSLSEHEGFCVPALEAMYFDVPVVAFSSTALPETVADGGLLLPDKDPVLVATAVHRVLTDTPLRESLVAAGRGRVEHFSLANNRRRLLEAVSTRLAAHG
jgi:glycosyltransferase involved in cell wall biosynthesis